MVVELCTCYPLVRVDFLLKSGGTHHILLSWLARRVAKLVKPPEFVRFSAAAAAALWREPEVAERVTQTVGCVLYSHTLRTRNGQNLSIGGLCITLGAFNSRLNKTLAEAGGANAMWGIYEIIHGHGDTMHFQRSPTFGV